MEPTTQISQLTAALAAAERGWHVFPLVCGSKRPAVRAWEDRATTDPERITRCWQTGPYNTGIACGPSGLLVVDLDTPKHEGDTPPPEWAEPGVHDGADVLAVLCERRGQLFPTETHIVRTGRGGLHLYFAAPARPALRNTSGLLGWKIDTRAAGGYVVAAGSSVDQRPYTLVHDALPAPLPSWLVALLTTDPATPTLTWDSAVWRERMHRTCAYTEAALRGELDKVLTASEGSRNHTLFTAAASLGRLVAAGTLPYDLAAEALTSAGQAIGLSAGECQATIRSGLHRGATTRRRAA